MNSKTQLKFSFSSIRVLRLFSLSLLILFSINVLAEQPPELPGEELMESLSSLPKAMPVDKKADKVIYNKQSTWIAPSIEEQLGLDKTLIGMGTGAIFVPMMTDDRSEPDIFVRASTGTKVLSKSNWDEGLSGHRIIVPPGDYKVAVGSGNLQQKKVFKVNVKEGHTSLVEVNWGGVIINTVDERGEKIEEIYEVFDFESGESYGRGYGQDESKGNGVKTWILPAGIYKIVPSTKDFSTVTEYITIKVVSGELVSIDMVFDNESGLVLGGGIQPNTERGILNTFWSQSLRVGGALSYMTILTEEGRKQDIFSMNTDVKYQLKYDDSKWLGVGEIYSLNNFQISKDKDADESDFSIITDDFSARATLIRRLRPWIGPYVKTTLKTHLVPKSIQSETDDSIIVLNRYKDTVSVLHDSELTINNPFFPMEFGEGIGLNLDIVSTPRLEISPQAGAAWRQTVNKDVLVKFSDSSDVYIPDENNRKFGLEASIFIRALISGRITLDLRGEVFVPEADFEEYLIEEASADLRLRIFRSFELSYLHELVDNKDESENVKYEHRFESKNSLTLRIFLNL